MKKGQRRPSSTAALLLVAPQRRSRSPPGPPPASPQTVHPDSVMALAASQEEGPVLRGHKSGRWSQGKVSGMCVGKAKASCFCMWLQAAQVNEAAPFPKNQ